MEREWVGNGWKMVWKWFENGSEMVQKIARKEYSRGVTGVGWVSGPLKPPLLPFSPPL